jgi:hypothetical protein
VVTLGSGFGVRVLLGIVVSKRKCGYKGPSKGAVRFQKLAKGRISKG